MFQDVALVGLAEPVVTHECCAGGFGLIGVFAVQEPQVGADFGQFLMHGGPVRLGEHAFVLAAASEQEFVDFVFGEVLEFVPAAGVGGGSVEGFCDAIAGNALGGRDGASSQALGAKLQYSLRFDLSYH